MKWPKLTRDIRYLHEWVSGLWPFSSSWGKQLQHDWYDIRLGIILFGLIILPSGILGYFSWRAVESEKLMSEHRLEESYRQFARLARHEIDGTLEKLEKRWLRAVDALFSHEHMVPDSESVRRVTEDEALIHASFLVTAEGKFAYPSGIRMRDETGVLEGRERQSYLREHQLFTELVAGGEELEYQEYDLDGALAVYRRILTEVTMPQFRAMGENMVGRVLMKKVEWNAALETFRKLLRDYPEVRNLHNLYLRFVAQYQIAVALENLGRDEEAIQTLLHLNKDLLERSDRINPLQYSQFLDLIKNLTPRLLTSPKISDPSSYESQFRTLAEQSKKRYSEQYFLQLLDRRLNEMGIEQKPYREKYYYVSDEADNEPFLLLYRQLPDSSGIYAAGLFGVQIDLKELRQQLFPIITRNLKFSEEVSLAILNKQGDFVLGSEGIHSAPIAMLSLAEPFEFWQVAVYRTPVRTVSSPFDFFTTLGLWLIGLLLFSILIGAYLFIRRVRYATNLSQMKSTFISNVSHEIRTPLASIRMMAELMEMDLPNRSPVAGNFRQRAEQYLGIIRRECDRLNRLIENILDLSKIERGLKQYNFEYEDLDAVVLRAVEAFRPHAESQGFLLSISVQEDLPEIRMDADAISQVMFNLLSNAVKYSDERREIHVLVHGNGERVVVEVTDRGIGIAASEIKKICDAFYRVDQRLNSQKQGGAGLGLALVQQIIQAHDGTLTVRSEVGQGSTFLFTLPVPSESQPPDDRLVSMKGTENVAVRPESHIESNV